MSESPAILVAELHLSESQVTQFISVILSGSLLDWSDIQPTVLAKASQPKAGGF